jgi:subtilisin-like proprotein convertase family protein
MEFSEVSLPPILCGKPTNGYDKIESLSAFDGLSPNGNWTLRVVDHVGGDCGEFGDGWSLTIKARVP